jgi:hypothetical protein
MSVAAPDAQYTTAGHAPFPLSLVRVFGGLRTCRNRCKFGALSKFPALPQVCIILPILLGAIVLCSRSALAADDPKTILLRPHFGLGRSDALTSGHTSGLSEHVGGRLLLQANPFQRYGLEVTALRVHLDHKATDYVGTGIVLEQVLWGWFNMGIGTVGYLRTTGGTPHPFGITSNLGYEHWLNRRLQLFAVYRSEWLFSRPTQTVSSVSLGVAVGF